MAVLRIFNALISRLFFRGRRHCNVCDHRLGWFLPYRGGWKSMPPLLRTLDVVGSDVDNFECPWCGSTDRERHLFMYMRATGLLDALPGMRVLHFAPEPHLSRLVASARPALYVKCDLSPAAADVAKIDIQAVPYPDETFDLVIANHVLEHVLDDVQALKELRRVLKPGGHAILQTPFSAKLQETWSDPGIDEDNARLQAYGQEDHVRLFGRKIFDRFSAAGLVSRVCGHDQTLVEFDSKEFGVNAAEPFFLFERYDD